ncbi:hypothetical protein AJ80_03313 [Polytolypa hystricis UAMH7299]|uniref:Uncharacterized protein n=1 Tax=Polytolypa hystricis (strain UAMH7299) TaxID=1447883 RepID=A0A2B7YIK9_POLH7|nr:hypothetical protein AJ80_03313 [Polytolypa hystricis UAMH7299]
MNRFRSRKKAKEDHVPRDHDAPPVPTLNPFKKNKKPQVEAKPVVDLTTVLPPSDDFRTSLLMPKLSARFSMLREQDDPNTKVGKANDDSVLFPKRASRLNVFGQSQLSDIAEVSSLSGSNGRPSLAIGRRSFGSGEGGYGTDDEYTSIMERRRPGEGNNLFGGRQKIYKIPVNPTSRSGSTSEASVSGSAMGGKAMYEEDVTLSAFQKMRIEERERELEEAVRANLDNVQANNKQGETSDSTSYFSSKPSFNRESTSATSLDSQSRISGRELTSPAISNLPSPAEPNHAPTGVERNPTKSRRLYEQGLELRNQQSSAISRLESLSRQRAAGADPTHINRSVSKSATSLNEKFLQRAPVYASSGFRPASPPPSASTSILEQMEASSNQHPSVESPNPNQGLFSPPISPPVSEVDDATMIAAALQPEDRGKATAMGLFNKPASKYDEQQYMRRQLQMHEGRNTPPLRRPSPTRVPSGTESVGRPRGQSTTSYRSKADSMTSRYSGSQDGVSHAGDRSAVSSMGRASPARPTNGTFLADFGGSDSGSDGEQEPALSGDPSSVARISDSIHPAFRSSVSSNDSGSYIAGGKSSHSATPDLRYSDSRDLKTIEENEAIEHLAPAIVEESAPSDEIQQGLDSPTLGPPGLGLSGLIRTHLRQNSDRSSIYPPPSPTIPPRPLDDDLDRLSAQNLPAANHTASIHSNPWEYDDLDKSQNIEKPVSPQPTQPDFTNMSIRAKQMLDMANALRSQGVEKDKDSTIQVRDPVKSPTQPTPESAPWQEEAKHGHQRGGSSETQVEREEFANELAERRRKVQEKLKSFAETESRSNSPTPNQRFPDYNSGKAGNAFAMLRNKAGRSHAGSRPDAPSKAMKMLGMENATLSASSPNLLSKDPWREEEDKMLREVSREPRSSSPHIGPGPGPRHQNWQRQPGAPPMQRHSQDDTQDSPRGRPYPPHPFSPPLRDRAGSDAPGRSKSGLPPREDVTAVSENPVMRRDETHMEDRKTSITAEPAAPFARSSSDVNDPIPSDRSSSVASGRFRSNSRSIQPAGYLEHKPPPSIQTNHPALIGPSPRPSPVTAYSANTTPPLFETSPTVSVASTPTGLPPSFGPSNSQRIQGLGSHKRAVDKSQISEPKFVSTTSNIPTLDLPAGASLSNGVSTPPIPPMNPRRKRQTATQTIFGALKGSDKHDTPPIPSPMSPNGPEEHSTFSDDEKHSKPRHRLRKSSSEGGNLNAKARQQLMNATSPAMPQFPKQQLATPMEGGMF